MTGKRSNNINNNVNSIYNKRVKTVPGMIMVGKYKNPPLVESVCEFTFPEKIIWDPTTIGLFSTKIKEFPIKDIKTKTVCDGGENSPEDHPNFERKEYVVFSNKEKIFDIGITERKLVIRALKPYSDWKIFRKVIVDSHNKLNGIIKAESCEIKFYYINIIKVLNTGLFTPENISGYFYFFPSNSSTKLPKKWDDFIVGYTHKSIKNNLLCRTTLSSSDEDKTKNQGYYLSLTVDNLRPIKTEEVPKWMEKSHEEINDAFEGCITDKLRQSFGPVKK
jgi:uncharacterized protein (TIGR04255 family)